MPTPPLADAGLIPVVGIGGDIGGGLGNGSGNPGTVLPVAGPDVGAPADVPEPQSIAIMAAGIAVMGVARRRKRRLPG
ncbi:PEP-CTERM sorting domain-containing protein [Massilia yuzhufengensis]|uniref:PEP-CTERM sorting domain-containing protein n=1 Tax=Massilia yuzhufengensis TaxID=1164594 RepID=UPI0015A69CF9|nr:PEP-CTERM sorting domain-containing protein [Massilia yuzhufengensis]